MNSQQQFSPEVVAKAGRILIKHQIASISLLQRHLHMGFTETQNLMALLEAMGIVAAANETGRRDLAPVFREGNPAFKEWALRKFEGCDGGDPGEPGRPSIWLFGIEHGDSPHDERAPEVCDTTYSITRQRTYPYNRNAFKLLAVMHGYRVENWLSFAEEYQPFVKGSRGFFKGNVYPIPCWNLEEWGPAAQQDTGFATKERYMDWCRSHRLPVVEAWAEEHRPDVVICTGTSHRHEYARVFFAERPVELLQHQYGPRKYLFHGVLDGRIIVVMRHLSGCRHSDHDLEYVGKYILQLRQNIAAAKGLMMPA